MIEPAGCNRDDAWRLVWTTNSDRLLAVEATIRLSPGVRVYRVGRHADQPIVVDVTVTDFETAVTSE